MRRGRACKKRENGSMHPLNEPSNPLNDPSNPLNRYVTVQLKLTVDRGPAPFLSNR